MLWLALNLPFNYHPIVSKEDFLSLFKRRFPKPSQDPQVLDCAEAFHQIATLQWLKLKSPGFEELRNAMLEVAAQVAVLELEGKGEGIDCGAYAKGLYESFLFLSQERKQLVSEPGFLNIFRLRLGSKWFEGTLSEEAEYIVRRYYNFGKRFVLYDFPISNFENNVIKASVILVRDAIYGVQMKVMGFIDRKTRAYFKRIEISLDNVYYASAQKFGKSEQIMIPDMYNEFDQDTANRKPKTELFLGMLEKTDGISGLVKELASQRVQSNRIVRGVDEYCGASEKFVASEIITEWFFRTMESLIFDNFVTRSYKKTKEGAVVMYEKGRNTRINMNAVKEMIKFFAKTGLIVLYENPKWFVIGINKFWFKEVPEGVIRTLVEGSGYIKKFSNVKESKNKAQELYSMAREKIKQGKEIVRNMIFEFEMSVQERRKREFPILASGSIQN